MVEKAFRASSIDPNDRRFTATRQRLRFVGQYDDARMADANDAILAVPNEPRQRLDGVNQATNALESSQIREWDIR